MAARIIGKGLIIRDECKTLPESSKFMSFIRKRFPGVRKLAFESTSYRLFGHE